VRCVTGDERDDEDDDNEGDNNADDDNDLAIQPVNTDGVALEALRASPSIWKCITRTQK
jgi:hypothetical protein